MGYSHQFEIFDPISGEVPRDPFSAAQSIATRARGLLYKRTADQIRCLAEDATMSISSYFEWVKSDEIERLVKERNEVFIEFDEEPDGFGWRIRPEMEDELEIPTHENTTELEALTESIGSWVDLSKDEVPEANEYEYFAAMALWNIGDYIKRRRYRYEFVNGAFIEQEIIELSDWDYRLLGDYLFDALEAVCHAEHLREEESMQKRYQAILKKIQAEHKAAAEKAGQDILEEAAKQFKEEEKTRRSQHAKDLGRLRHKPTYEAKDLVLVEWAKDRSNFRSAEKAGIYYSDWLEQRSLRFEPRTITGWIREYAKEHNIKLR